MSEFPAKNLNDAINKFLQNHFAQNQLDALGLGAGVFPRTACNYGYFNPNIMAIDLKRDNGVYIRVPPETIIKLNEMFAAKFVAA
jgi:hypothetical protein